MLFNGKKYTPKHHGTYKPPAHSNGYGDPYAPTDQYGGYDYGYGGGYDYGYGGGYGGGYGYAVPRYGLDPDLANRLRRLLRTITGRTFQFVEAPSWCAVGDKICYNARDVADAFEGEVFGMMLRELARQLYYDWAALAAEQQDTAERPYKHLRALLEERRALSQLVGAYAGAADYTEALAEFLAIKDIAPPSKLPAMAFLVALDRYTIGRDINDALEAAPETVAAFSEALPAVAAYLGAATMAETAEAYAAIKALYPAPDPDDQKQQQAMQRYRPAEAGDGEALGTEARQDEAQDGAAARRGKQWRAGTAIGTVNRAPDEYQREAKRHARRSAALAAQLRSVLIDNTAIHYGGRYRSGKKFTARGIVKLAMATTRRPFIRRIVERTPEYAFAVCVDQSGSMGGKPMATAYAASVMLIEALHSAGLPFAVYGYGNRAEPYIPLYAPLDREKLRGLSHAELGGTNESAPLKHLLKDFASVPRARRGAVFVLTDGQTDDSDGLREACKALDAQGVPVFCLATLEGNYVANADYMAQLRDQHNGSQRVQVLDAHADRSATAALAARFIARVVSRTVRRRANA